MFERCVRVRMQEQETLAGSGIVTVRAGSTAGLKAGSLIACATWHNRIRCLRSLQPLIFPLKLHSLLTS